MTERHFPQHLKHEQAILFTNPVALNALNLGECSKQLRTHSPVLRDGKRHFSHSDIHVYQYSRFRTLFNEQAIFSLDLVALNALNLGECSKQLRTHSPVLADRLYKVLLLCLEEPGVSQKLYILAEDISRNT